MLDWFGLCWNALDWDELGWVGSNKVRLGCIRSVGDRLGRFGLG